jgi:hypothetical protein
MVPLYYRDKIVLVAFGGNKKEPSDKVKELNLPTNITTILCVWTSFSDIF